MGDNLNRRGPEDGKLINVNQDHEVTYWTRQLGVSAQELKSAVAAVGTSADAVRRYLKK